MQTVFLRVGRATSVFLVLVLGLSLVPAGVGLSPAAAAQLVATISLKDQRMEVVAGGKRYSWKVSTARPGYRTPTGTFRPQRMYKRYFSRKYDNSPMPHSVFFYHGYAIHGTTDIRRLGRPASHGCVRLHPKNASTLYGLVKKYGMRNTRIVVRR